MTIGNGLDQALGPRRGCKNIGAVPVLTDEVVAKAEANRISKKTLRIRVQQLLWPLEKATTHPVDTTKQHYKGARA